MPGLVDQRSLGELVDAVRRGSLTPTLSVSQGPTPPTAGAIRIPPLLGRQLVQIMVSDIKGRFSSGTDPQGQPWVPLKWPRPTGGDKPLRDTGVLMASFTGRFDATSVTVGTTHPGAALHNFGGTVRARNKMLAIPLTKEARRSGGPRRFGRTLRFQPTGKRRVFVLYEMVNGQRVGQFLLVDQVTVPQREFMGLSPRGLQNVQDAITDAVVKGWLDRG